MKEYLEGLEAVFRKVNSTADGLTSAEAEKRLSENGKNKLAEKKKDSIIKQFFSQMADPMIIILLAAAFISAVTSRVSGDGMADVFIILFVVVVNAVLGVYQENKAEKAIEALQQMAAATCKVLRDGKVKVVKSEDIVVGDVVILEAGDAVPADGRIIESVSMKIEESALTGESVPVNKFIDIINLENAKDVPLGDRKNMAYMGSTVVYGRGAMVVTATGMDTEMGKIADALSKAEEGETPLQLKLDELSKTLTKLVLGICVVIFIVGLIRTGAFTADVILNTFMIAVSLAVAAIPEGLVAVVTIVLSIGVTNMSKRNAIIRKLTAVETLGCVQVICSDKTGTLTQNRMTVVDSYGEDEKLLATAMSLCSDAQPTEDGGVNGEPTEAALVTWAEKLGLHKSDLQSTMPRVGEAPFDSGRKMMSTVHKAKNGFIQYTKGGLDEVLARCTHYLKNGKPVPITDSFLKEIHQANSAMAGKALRVLAAAQKTYQDQPESFEPEAIENGLCFLGIAGMIDPVRPEVKPAIDECKTAGIRTIMITGDHIDTATAIAKELGILAEGQKAVSGSELNEMDDEQFEKVFQSISVYARVQPEHKTRIVNAWRKAGYVTAMTGDGVNDAPSIKSADIGIGMGITGTDVTKNAADMVIADDNFATIVGAVEEGRRIYDNIRKAIQFLLSSNMSEVLAIFFATILGFTILEPVHLLWINLVTDCFTAIGLGLEKAENDIMRRKPRSSKASIFAGGMGLDIAYQGLVITFVTLAAYFIGHFMEQGSWEITNSIDGTTMAFLTMNMAEIFHSLNMRSQRGSIFKLKHKNNFMTITCIAALALTSAVIYIPFLSVAFDFAEISLVEYIVALLLAFAVIPIVEVVKFFQRKRAA